MAVQPQPAEAERLTQADVELLLAQAAEEGKHAIVRKPGGVREKLPRAEVRSHDFGAPSFLGRREWRQLRREQEAFAELLAGRLSNDLRLDIAVRVGDLRTTSCREYLAGLPEPAHLALFKLEPLRGISILEMAPHLGLAMVDRLLGGPGQASSINRDLSEIEMALLDQLLEVILGQWCQHWAKVQDLRPRILGHENSARYVQIAPADAPFLVVRLDIRWGEFIEQLCLAFPCQMLEPLLRQLAPSLHSEEKLVKAAPSAAPKWNPAFGGIAVQLSAEWPSRQVNAGQVARLKVGDILEWDPGASTEIRLKIATSPKFLGRLGTRNGRWAIEVTGPYRDVNR
jgi:flagellar motor switch protein FliM